MNKKLENREMKTVSFNVVDKGLGIYLIGGEERKDEFDISGIFIKSVLPGGLASIDGRLKKGDQVGSVNGQSFADISKEKAIEVLTQASEEGFVQLKILRDDQARQDYHDMCDLYAFSRSSSPLISQISQDVNKNIRDGSWGMNERGLSDKKKVRKEVKDGRMADEVVTEGDSYSIDPNVRLKIQRLKQSLGFLGFNLNREEEERLRRALDVDEHGTVAYGEFVKKVKEMFVEDSRIDDFTFHDYSHRKENTSNDILAFKESITQKDAALRVLERELTRYKNENLDLKQDVALLRNKVRLADEFRKAAVENEKDYALVMARLEEEKANLIMSSTDRSPTNKFEARRAEVGKQIQQNATHKLLSFARFVVETMTQRRQPSSSALPLDFTASDDVIVREAQKSLRAVQLLLMLDDEIPEKNTKASKLSFSHHNKLSKNSYSKSSSNLHDLSYSNNDSKQYNKYYTGNDYNTHRNNKTSRYNITTNNSYNDNPSFSILKRPKNRDSLLSLPPHFT